MFKKQSLKSAARTRKISFLTLLFVVAAGFAVAPVWSVSVSALASGEGVDSNKGASHTTETKEAEVETTKAKTETGHPAIQRVCKNRQASITTIMDRINNRGQKQLDLYTKVSERVQKFYTDKGHILSNYSELVAAVNTQKAAAQVAVDALAHDKAGFSCDNPDPKAAATRFKADQKTVTEALKSYRAAIKALVQGVKSVQPKPTAKANNGGQQ